MNSTEQHRDKENCHTLITNYLDSLKCFKVNTKGDEHFCIAKDTNSVIELVENNPSSMGYDDGSRLAIVEVIDKSISYLHGDMFVDIEGERFSAVFTDEVYQHIQGLVKHSIS